jgi:hypothetical protein
MSGDEYVKAQKLPLDQTFGLLDIAERVAFERPLALGPKFVKLAVFTLNHASIPIPGKKNLNSLLLFAIIPCIICG